MELLTALAVALLFGIGAYLLLTRNIIRVILGASLISYGLNMMLMSTGLLKRGQAPILVEGALAGGNLLRGPNGNVLGGSPPVYADPVPQALILTAIVIGFAVTAFLFVLGYRTVQEHGTDNLYELRGEEHDE
ncbi:MAG TPA: NADH-quinone oxidoreductase subunit K [Symbiobacteriaceae bacterium]|nr:NADH-quinone oxidoreductase subunit K [Symbiobacteriaceae bacterium]